MKTQQRRYFVGDFETTVFEGQTYTEVWSSACAELYTDDIQVFHSIAEQYEFFVSLYSNIVCYYHNLKFDGTFWLNYLLANLGYKQAIIQPVVESTEGMQFIKPNKMRNNEVAYVISNMGQWYKIVFKTHDKIIELRDSLKLLPFSLERIGKSFETKHRKLDMEYKGKRYAGCHINEKEMEYIKNDVYVLKEAMEKMFSEGHTRLTIGSCCMHEYKEMFGQTAWERYFPNLYEHPIDKDIYGSQTAGDYVKNSYHGGWCYVAKGKENTIFENGVTLDVNSLYPSMMSSESGNFFPVGNPTFWKGDFIPEEAKKGYYFVRFKTRFNIKKNKLPFVQIKTSLLYKVTEMLETSDIYYPKDEKYYEYYKDNDGTLKKAVVTLTMTETDFCLFLEHYDVSEFEILDGCYFKKQIGIFDAYINKYKEIKLNSTGAKRELAKLYLNNLYGKFAASTNSTFKVAFLKDDNSLGFYPVVANDKEPGYIPIGSAITSYARNFTIRAAQANYYGKDKPGFIYADTDSIHCNLPLEQIKGVKLDSKAFCYWKNETSWKKGKFVRQKTYIEEIIKEDWKDVKPYYNIKCAGLPSRSKELLLQSMRNAEIGNRENYSDLEWEFVQQKRTMDDFKMGIVIPGKLLPKRIPGGVILVDTSFEMR